MLQHLFIQLNLKSPKITFMDVMFVLSEQRWIFEWQVAKFAIRLRILYFSVLIFNVIMQEIFLQKSLITSLTVVFKQRLVQTLVEQINIFYVFHFHVFLKGVIA